MVTHDPYAASFANRILVFQDGRILRELLDTHQNRQSFYERILDEVARLDTDR